ncbi:universal stress protein [Actinomycetospora lutea]|uniref:universal stress protein n=1 Tax=Actinomycetospora lutea TaxID=663604 RepID=UPI002366082D|nr:universal stress protein [Actinomycetospora lutea]MDD7939543.1 universal stress protein [Actinomycetospora lutea]
MTTPEQDRGEVVRVFAPAGPGRRAVLRWAGRQARRSGARLEVLVEPDTGPGPRDGPDSAPAALVGRALGALAGPSPADRLIRAAAGSRLLVVPQRAAGVDELVDAAYESVTVVPDEAPHLDGPVVLALAPHTSDAVVDAAFEAASRRGARLLAVWCRGLERGGPSRDGEDAGDTDDTDDTDAGRRWWEDRLAAWRIVHPRMPVEIRVAENDPVAALVDLSGRARLLVLGRSVRGRVLAALRPSPVPRVVRRARCPVLVVAPPGPPHRGWWRRP